MIAKHLALLLDAPLQSWGHQSRFDQRTSLAYPTRSAMIGLLAAAMGIDRQDTKGLQEFSDLEMTSYTFCQGPLLEDFHTIGGGWDKKKNPQHLVVKFDGKPGNKGKPGDTVVSRRQYLQETCFGVILKAPAGLAEKIAAALANPRWGIWLGRKSCIPASPVLQGIFATHEEALESLASHERLVGKKPLRVVREVADFDQGTDTLMDNPLDFGRRLFAPRRIAVE